MHYDLIKNRLCDIIKIKKAFLSSMNLYQDDIFTGYLIRIFAGFKNVFI